MMLETAQVAKALISGLQVVREFKRTAYRPKMAILVSTWHIHCSGCLT